MGMMIHIVEIIAAYFVVPAILEYMGLAMNANSTPRTSPSSTGIIV